MTAATRPPRILVVLHEPGYYRLYGSTIVELERRGWDVTVAFDNPEKRGSGAGVPRGAGPGVRIVNGVPASPAGAMAALRSALDYLRYADPPFAGAQYLRGRAARAVPRRLRFLTRVGRMPRSLVTGAIAVARTLERVIPPGTAAVEFLRAARPDAVLVSPLVMPGRRGSQQTEIIKAGQALGLPVMVGVASWDHLTSKGLVRIVPDVLFVWNETQQREAVELHRIPRTRVVVTGAQSLDHWFTPPPPGAARRFRSDLGIPLDRRVILFVGSSRKMAAGTREVEFFERWLRALRESRHPDVRRAFIVVRPHPSNTAAWCHVAVGPDVRVHPREYSGIPLSDNEVEEFRRSMLACSAVVGVNTTAMIEAAILARPVLSVRAPEFVHSQQETLHFSHLAADRGGCAQVAVDLPEHIEQLQRVLDDPAPLVQAAAAFVDRFVRPLGRSTPAVHHLCDAIEQVAARSLAPTVARGRRAAAQRAAG